MKKLNLLILLFLFIVSTGCSKQQPVDTTITSEEDVIVDESLRFQDVPNTMINGDFETGDLRGWTVTGTAFTSFGVTKKTHYWDTQAFNHQGEWHFHGAFSGIERGTGTLESSPFRITGNGSLSFLMGAGRDQEKVYVALCDAITNEELVKVSNQHFSDPDNANNYHSYTIDLTQYVNKVVYVKVVDSDNDGDFGFINVDGFLVNYE